MYNVLKNIRLALVFCFLGYSTIVKGQENYVQLNVEKSTLQDVFTLLEQQTGYTFAYDEKIINLRKRITLNRTGTLRSLLDLLGKSAMLDMQISGRRILVRPLRLGRLSGHVVDEKGDPLSAVNIYVREFNQQYITDQLGNYSISYPMSRFAAVNITFSMLGRQEQNVKVSLSEEKISIAGVVMPQLSIGLDEIAVQPKSRKELNSNSSLYINRELIEQSGALSLNDLLNLMPNRKIEALHYKMSNRLHYVVAH